MTRVNSRDPAKYPHARNVATCAVHLRLRASCSRCPGLRWSRHLNDLRIGAGVGVERSVRFFSAVTGWPLEPGAFGVANLFMPTDPAYEGQARGIVRAALERQGLEVLLERLVPVDPAALRPAAVAYQPPIVQWIFVARRIAPDVTSTGQPTPSRTRPWRSRSG